MRGLGGDSVRQDIHPVTRCAAGGAASRATRPGFRRPSAVAEMSRSSRDRLYRLGFSAWASMRGRAATRDVAVRQTERDSDQHRLVERPDVKARSGLRRSRRTRQWSTETARADPGPGEYAGGPPCRERADCATQNPWPTPLLLRRLLTVVVASGDRRARPDRDRQNGRARTHSPR